MESTSSKILASQAWNDNLDQQCKILWSRYLASCKSGKPHLAIAKQIALSIGREAIMDIAEKFSILCHDTIYIIQDDGIEAILIGREEDITKGTNQHQVATVFYDRIPGHKLQILAKDMHTIQNLHRWSLPSDPEATSHEQQKKEKEIQSAFSIYRSERFAELSTRYPHLTKYQLCMQLPQTDVVSLVSMCTINNQHAISTVRTRMTHVPIVEVTRDTRVAMFEDDKQVPWELFLKAGLAPTQAQVVKAQDQDVFEEWNMEDLVDFGSHADGQLA